MRGLKKVVEYPLLAFYAFADWYATWKGGAIIWAITNTIIAQTAQPDDLLSWGLTLAGVTIPFGVGWAWNRQWADAVRRQNEFLKEQDQVLRQELVEERAEKMKVYDENDDLRRQLGQFQVDLMVATGQRDELEHRLERLEKLVKLRKEEVQIPPTGDRRKRRVDLKSVDVDDRL